jgi:hypothetical protein
VVLAVVLPIYVAYAVYLMAHMHVVGVDFRGELYPEAKLVLRGADPFPPTSASLASGVNRIWPIPAALLVAPLTLLPVTAAAVVFALLLVVALGVSLRLLGVTDWRVYAVVAMWPAALSAVQTANLTILLVLLVALLWRFREHRFIPGLALGLAVALKLYLWPLAVYLVARRRFASAGVAAVVGLGSTLLVLPFTSLGAYVQLMRRLGDTFGPESYNIVGLLVQTRVASTGVATVVAVPVCLVLLAVAYRRRSLGIAVAAALLLSPITWIHYYVFLAVPLALSRPRLAPAWAIPLALYLCPGNGANVVAWNTVVVLAVLALVTTLAERRGEAGGLDRGRLGGLRPTPSPQGVGGD